MLSEKDKISKENENIYLGLLILLAAVVIIFAFKLEEATSKLDDIPECVEDEYLLPLGDNTFRCVHVDEIKEN